ncbi:MAG: glycosyltransferase family 4 protein [Gammaproteobacteria bacterium]|nr:glycosyltransferase family 4 protein [Gammaproteobacteria bacterium]
MSSAHRESTARPLTIIELCLSQGRGGLEHYAADLVPDLSQRGHRVIVVAREDTDYCLRAGREPALTFRPHRYLPWAGARKLCALVKTTRADAIHIHRSADLPLAVMAKRCAGNRPALVYSRHMHITRDRRASWPHRFMFRHVDRLLTITEQIAKAADRHLPILPERILALPPGVNPGSPDADCTTIRPPDTDFVAGCFSRVEPGKGQHELIDAIFTLREHGIRAGAVFAGAVMDPAYDKRIRSHVEALELGEVIRFLGTLEDARSTMACCDAVALPSVCEPLGLVLVEAMLMNVPVVATAAGGVLEFVDDGVTGLTYAAGDAQALTHQLHRLATEPNLKRTLARNGRSAAAKRFDRGKHLDRLEALLLEAAAERAKITHRDRAC